MIIEAMKLAAEFNRYFTSCNGVDVPAKVSVSRDEWRALLTAIQRAEAKQPDTTEPAKVVPYNPTEEMRWAMKRIDPALSSEQCRALWSAAWSATPSTHPAQATQTAEVTGEPVYQICKKDSQSISSAWIDVEKQVYEDAGIYPEYGRRTLYTHPAPSVPDDVVRDAISTVREHYRGTDWGKAAESICDAIDAMLAAK